MKALPKSQILRFAEKAIHLARRAVSRYSSKFSKHRYTLPQHVVLLCLKVRKNTTYRGLLDELIEMPRIRRVLELAELPAPSTLCKAFDRLDMAVWRVLLTLSDTTTDERHCWSRCVRVRPESRLKTLHETRRTHDSAAQSDVVGRYEGERHSRSPCDDDTKTR